MEKNSRSQVVSDYFIYILLCVEDDTILVAKGDEHDNYALITTILKPNESWNGAGRRLAKQVIKDENPIIEVACPISSNFNMSIS